MLFPRVSVVDGVRQATEARRLLRSRLRWGHLGDVPPVVSVEQAGLSHLAETLTTLNPVLIVAPACEAWGGHQVAELSRLTGVCVLSARRPARGTAIVAASSLLHPGHPVLQVGARYARALNRRLTVTHNLEPLPVVVGPAETFPLSLAAFEQDVALKLVRELEAAARQLDADVAFSREGDTPSGIVHPSEEAGADLVIVGCAGPEGVLSRNVTSRVVSEATASVLVVPIPGHAPASSAEAPRTPQETP
jgi:nucleotide-binding universal stress UspA family protein